MPKKGFVMKGNLLTVKINRLIISLIIIMILLLGLYFFILNNNSEEDLSSALDKNELLIDYTIDESLAYTLINKKGIKEYGDFFVVFERVQDGWQRIYENNFRQLMPWKLDVADIDGDNKQEILIALRKTTPFDNEIKNRMFIFNFNDNILSRKWTGSQIAGIWREFYTIDILPSSGSELVFIEESKGKMERISIYSWFDFGFFRIADSETYNKITGLDMVSDNLLELTYNDGERENKLLLTVVDGKLIPKE